MIKNEYPVNQLMQSIQLHTLKRLLKCFLFFMIMISFQGCSLFEGSPAEQSSESWKAGNTAFDAGDYKSAVSHFRDISTESVLYPEAVKMIQKIPFQKGIAAYELKQYRRAFSEFSKVPRQSEYYQDAQKYINICEYNVARDRYEKAGKDEKAELLVEMVQYANKAGGSKPLLESVDTINQALSQSQSIQQTKQLVNLLGDVISSNKNLAVQEKAMNHILNNFEKFYQQEEVRSKIFEIIGKIKLNING